MMRLAVSSAQPFCRPASARTISVAKTRGFLHGFAGAAWNPRVSRSSVSARMVVPGREELVLDRIDDPDYVRPLDTSLDDGEQSPAGAIMTSNDKLLLANQHALLDAVRSIPMEVANTPVGDGEGGHVLSGCNQRDIDVAFEASNPHTDNILATSTLPVKPEHAVSYDRRLGLHDSDVGLGPEDACRLNQGGLYHILEEKIKAGGTTLNILDTDTGDTFHQEFVKLIAGIKANTPGFENAIISNDCQNDINLASANTSMGVLVVALRLEVTINGSDERARNASLDEVVMTTTRELSGGLYTVTNEMVQEQSGLHAQTNKATFGANGIAHESEISQDLNGMPNFKGTSEITSSGDVGSTHENDFDNGKLSGSHSVGTKLVEPPASLDSRMHTITDFLDLMRAAISVCVVSIRLVQQSPECLQFMWQMAQPCLRVMAFSGICVMLAAGVGAMFYGMGMVLKAKSTSQSE